MAGMDAETGRRLDGWAHCEATLRRLWATRYAELLGLRSVGSGAPGLLGRSSGRGMFLRLAQALTVAADLYEPRFKVRRVAPSALDETGKAGVIVTGVYRPRGHLGDFTPEGSRTIQLG